jgi:hypothetical protein
VQVTDGAGMNPLLRALANSNTIPSISIEFPAQNIQLSLEGVYVTSVGYAPDDRQSASNFTIIGVNLAPERFVLTSSDSSLYTSWTDGALGGTLYTTCKNIPVLYRNSSSIPIVGPGETSFERIDFRAASSSSPGTSGKNSFTPILLSNVQAAGNAPCYMASAMELLSPSNIQIELYDTSTTLFSRLNLIDPFIETYRLNISAEGLSQDIQITYSTIEFTP